MSHVVIDSDRGRRCPYCGQDSMMGAGRSASLHKANDATFSAVCGNGDGRGRGDSRHVAAWIPSARTRDAIGELDASRHAWVDGQ
jgi:hypothetical protein